MADRPRLGPNPIQPVRIPSSSEKGGRGRGDRRLGGASCCHLHHQIHGKIAKLAYFSVLIFNVLAVYFHPRDGKMAVRWLPPSGGGVPPAFTVALLPKTPLAAESKRNKKKKALGVTTNIHKILTKKLNNFSQHNQGLTYAWNPISSCPAEARPPPTQSCRGGGITNPKAARPPGWMRWISRT